MRKLNVKVIALLVVTSLFIVSCTKKEETKTMKLKVGMVTDAGTIDDKSFNQGTWEGVLRAQDELEVSTKYLKPAGTTEADYMKEIGNLYDAGYKFIVTPGFKFATAIEKAQAKYADAKFVILDAAPSELKENTVAVFFTEHESGFLAGVATALQIKEGGVGFIGGMEIPPVQKFNWGFQQGVTYANDNYNTNVTLDKQNIIYQGTFHEVAAGQQLAAQMYDRDVKAIFAAAGGVGVGAINEAKSRATKGEMVYIVGVDVDQYADGIYEGDKSVVLTSAMKRIDNAAFDMIKANLDGQYPGGQMVTLDATNGGVSLPAENPNLSADVEDKAMQVLKKIQSGEIKVSGEQGNLIR